MNFEEAMMEVILFDDTDVISTSGEKEQGETGYEDELK